MENPTILVADGDPKNLQILRENLESSGFEVIVAADGVQAWQKISAGLPDLILSEVNLPQLDGFQLLEKLKADPATSAIPLMFLTNRRELQDRVRSLRGGVKDYMIKPLHVKEVLARIRMILRRMERLKEDEVETSHKLVGRLEEFSPVDLIESFGVERKTGILTLRNENNRSGEIYFREGAVVNSSLGNLKAEKAVYQMLPWKHGHFTMIFKELSVPDEISVSNLGLLLQGFKRMEERERLFKLLPSPETTFVTTETFRSILAKRELAPEVAKFISLINGRHDILQIIDESTYDDIKSLERLVKLYQQGFVKPGKGAAAMPVEDDTDLSDSLAEPKIVQKIMTEAELSSQKTTAVSEKPQAPQKTRTPAMVKTSVMTQTAATPAADLPPFRPSVKLTPPVAAAEDKKEEKKETAAAPLLEKQEPPPPVFPPEPPSSDAETVALELPEFGDEAPPMGHEIPDLEQVEGLETSAKKNGNENLWPDAGMAAPETGPAIDEDDMIEIREMDDESPGEVSSTTEIDRILRTIGRGLSPEYVEAELLPLDLNELMQRPMAPPPFIKEERAAEKSESPFKSEPAPVVMQDPAGISMDTIAPLLPMPELQAQTDRLDLAPELPAMMAEEEAFSPIIDLRKTKSFAATPSEPAMNTPEGEIAPPSPHAQQEINAPPRAELPVEPPSPLEPDVAFHEERENIFAQNLYDIPHEAIPEYVDVVKMEKQAAMAIAPASPVETPAPTPVAAVAAPSEAPAPVLTLPAPNWNVQISNHLLCLANVRRVERPKLVVIGRDGFHISALVKNLLGSESSLRKVASATFQHLELGERKVGAGRPFDIIGISIEQQFTKLLATVAKDLAGYVMLVEAHRRQDLNYLGYLLNTLRSLYRVPAAIAVVRAKDQKNLSNETVRDLLNAEMEFVEECSPLDPASVATFLQGLTSEATLARWANPA